MIILMMKMLLHITHRKVFNVLPPLSLKYLSKINQNITEMNEKSAQDEESQNDNDAIPHVNDVDIKSSEESIKEITIKSRRKNGFS